MKKVLVVALATLILSACGTGLATCDAYGGPKKQHQQRCSR
jgi:hypothetical protein